MKAKISSPESACRKTMKLWKYIAENIEELNTDNKCCSVYLLKEMTLYDVGYKENVKNSCFCCEYVMNFTREEQDIINCTHCPMTDFWIDRRILASSDTSDILGYEKYYSCEEPDSPYDFFSSKFSPYCFILDKDEYFNNMEEYAYRIYKLAQEALEYWSTIRSMNIMW